MSICNRFNIQWFNAGTVHFKENKLNNFVIDDCFDSKYNMIIR